MHTNILETDSKSFAVLHEILWCNLLVAVLWLVEIICRIMGNGVFPQGIQPLSTIIWQMCWNIGWWLQQKIINLIAQSSSVFKGLKLLLKNKFPYKKMNRILTLRTFHSIAVWEISLLYIVPCYILYPVYNTNGSILACYSKHSLYMFDKTSSNIPNIMRY